MANPLDEARAARTIFRPTSPGSVRHPRDRGGRAGRAARAAAPHRGREIRHPHRDHRDYADFRHRPDERAIAAAREFMREECSERRPGETTTVPRDDMAHIRRARRAPRFDPARSTGLRAGDPQGAVRRLATLGPEPAIEPAERPGVTLATAFEVADHETVWCSAPHRQRGRLDLVLCRPHSRAGRVRLV